MGAVTRAIRYVYVAGPITAGDQLVSCADAIHICDDLAEEGFIPHVPYMHYSWHMMHPHPYEFWLQQDEAWLSRCDALLRLPGISVESDREVAFANEHGIPVFYSIDGLLEAADDDR